MKVPEAHCVCRYAWECQTAEGGWGLDGVLREHAWKLRGIVNGMDYAEWSPQSDPHLRSDGYSNYGPDDLAAGKARCKAALQRVRAPLIVVCRLVQGPLLQDGQFE